MKKTLLVLAILSVSGWSQGASYRSAFPDFPPEPYGAAIGGAAVALVGNTSAAFWNPAGVAFLEGKGIAAGGSKFQNWPIYSANLAYAQGDQGFGAAAFLIEHLGLKAYDSRVKYQENVVSYTWAKNIGGRIGIGVKGKYVMASSDLQNVGATGLSVDLGVLFNLQGFVNIGFVAKDILSTLKWKTGRVDHLPIVFEGGIGTKPIFQRLSMFVSFRGEQGMGISDIGVGAEGWIMPGRLSLRFGINDRLLNNTIAMSGGLGIIIPLDIFSSYFINYSFEMGQNIIGVQHRFSIGLNWE